MKTKLERALAARNKAIDVIRKRGRWKPAAANERIVEAVIGRLTISYRAPLQKLSSGTEKLRYLGTLVGNKATLPYGLNVWLEGKKVLNLEWDEDGAVELISYKYGDWEILLASEGH